MQMKLQSLKYLLLLPRELLIAKCFIISSQVLVSFLFVSLAFAQRDSTNNNSEFEKKEMFTILFNARWKATNEVKCRRKKIVTNSHLAVKS